MEQDRVIGVAKRSAKAGDIVELRLGSPKTKSLIIRLSPEMHEAITGAARRGGHTIKGFVIRSLITFDPSVRKVWDRENGKS